MFVYHKIEFTLDMLNTPLTTLARGECRTRLRKVQLHVPKNDRLGLALTVIMPSFYYTNPFHSTMYF